VAVDPGVWTGVAFFALVFGGMYVVSALEQRIRRDAEREARAKDSGRTSRVLGRMRQLVRPTLLLVPAKAPGFSKLGGDPELAADMAWPTSDRGARTFLAQIDLAAFRPHLELDWLPREGRFYAFYDPERHGCADVVRVLYSTDEPGPPIPAPAGVRWRFPERRVAFMVFNSAPSPDWLNLDPCDIDLDFETVDERRAGFADMVPPDELQHRIGGYPNEIQAECMRLSCEHMARGLPAPDHGAVVPPAIERASKQWRLLLQIDSDPGLKMNWGDGGLLYVFIREKDALAGDFSKTVSIWQTH
jgi:uncharacterized protein YwqG